MINHNIKKISFVLIFISFVYEFFNEAGHRDDPTEENQKLRKHFSERTVLNIICVIHHICLANNALVPMN